MRSKLKDRMREHGFPLGKLAAAMGVSRQTLWRWCAGDGIKSMSLGRAESAARILGCRVSDLFEEE